MKPLKPRNKFLLFFDEINKKGNSLKKVPLNAAKKLFERLDSSERARYEGMYEKSFLKYKEAKRAYKKDNADQSKRRKVAIQFRRNPAESSEILDRIVIKIEERNKKSKPISDTDSSSSSEIGASPRNTSAPNRFCSNQVDLYLSTLIKRIKCINEQRPIARPFKVSSGKSYIFRISLKGVEPSVYRTLLLSGENNLLHFHVLIQLAFGWRNCNGHEFTQRGHSLTYPNILSVCSTKEQYNKEKATLIDDLNLKDKDKLLYLYDLGIKWEHLITCVSITEGDEKIFSSTPGIIDGRRACPPENYGSPCEYTKLAKNIRSKSPLSEDDQEFLEGLYDGVFDPDFFDLLAAKKVMKLWEVYYYFFYPEE
jgi:hypothetical protein